MSIMMALPLEECIIALSGTLKDYSHHTITERFIKPLGATLSKNVSSKTTHLITINRRHEKCDACPIKIIATT